MELYLKLIDVIAPVFFVIGVGYYLGKKNPKLDTNFITIFAGNIGTPLCKYAHSKKHEKIDWVVAELSSYQIEISPEKAL